MLRYEKGYPFIVILYEILATFPFVIQDKDLVDYSISENTQLVKSLRHLVSQVMRSDPAQPAAAQMPGARDKMIGWG